jgi:uncharacterized protein YsxB (DUF464 family)
MISGYPLVPEVPDIATFTTSHFQQYDVKCLAQKNQDKADFLLQTGIRILQMLCDKYKRDYPLNDWVGI